jgi:hypothetical protein
MNIDPLSLLPPWDDKEIEKYNPTEKGEEWKVREERSAAKALYNQWREIYHLVYTYTDTMIEEKPADAQGEMEESHQECTQRLVYENLFIVAPKILGAASVNSYVLKMENAAIIRTNIIQMMEQLGFAALMGWAMNSTKPLLPKPLKHSKHAFATGLPLFVKTIMKMNGGCLFNLVGSQCYQPAYQYTHQVTHNITPQKA